MAYEHSPERDQEIFDEINKIALQGSGSPEKIAALELLLEVTGIAKKWRAKANMREQRITELEQQLDDR